MFVLVESQTVNKIHMLAYHKLYFPCLVYKRDRANRPYVFSHACNLKESIKPFPIDLKVSSLLLYKKVNVHRAIMRQPILILVSGDIAKSITIAGREGTEFLYYKSQYDSMQADYVDCVDFDNAYVHCEYYSTLAMYKHGKLQGVNEIQSSIVLIPKTLKKADISHFQYNVRHSVYKSLNTSLFICDQQVYREESLQLKSTTHIYENDETTKSCTLESIMTCVAA